MLDDLAAAFGRFLHRRRAQPQSSAPGDADTVDSSSVWDLVTGSPCVLIDVRVSAVVRLDDEALIGFTGSDGSWFAPADPRADADGLVRAQRVDVVLHVARAADAGVGLAERWMDRGTRLLAFLSPERATVGLVDPTRGTVLRKRMDPLTVRRMSHLVRRG